jgi:hypothetical protein
VPSSRLAGRGYPRARIEYLLVSPIDNASFAAAAAGMVLYGSSVDTPAIVVSTDAEADFGATGSYKGYQVELRGWDAITNDLHFYFRPFWSFTQPAEGAYTLPARAATFTLSSFLPAPGFLNAFGSCCLWSNTGDELYTQAGILMTREPPYQVRARDGSLVVSANASPAQCSTITGRFICSGSELAEFDLSTMKTRYSVPLYTALRAYAGEPAGRELYVVGAPEDGALIAASWGYVEAGIGKIDVARIRTWPTH